MVATPVGHSPSQKSKIFASPLKEGAKTRDALSHRRCDTFTKINYNLSIHYISNIALAKASLASSMDMFTVAPAAPL